MKILITIGIIAIIGFVWLLWEIKQTPDGYEDKDGFHEGKEP